MTNPFSKQNCTQFHHHVQAVTPKQQRGNFCDSTMSMGVAKGSLRGPGTLGVLGPIWWSNDETLFSQSWCSLVHPSEEWSLKVHPLEKIAKLPITQPWIV